MFARMDSLCFQMDIWTAIALNARCIKGYFMFQQGKYDLPL
jgi:hypothetical protein